MASNLFSATLKLILQSFEIFFTVNLSKPSGQFNPVPTAVPPIANSDR